MALIGQLAAAALLASCQAAAVAPSPAREAGLRALFPPSLAFQASAPPVRLRGLGGPELVVHPVRFEPEEPDTLLRNAYRCGVVIEQGGRTQALTTVGAPGWTETVSCDGLVESGLVPGPDGGARVVLIYATRSPNAEGRTAVVLTRDAQGWAIDETWMERLAEASEPPTLVNVRARLAARR
jgi:hypothetical protein